MRQKNTKYFCFQTTHVVSENKRVQYVQQERYNNEEGHVLNPRKLERRRGRRSVPFTMERITSNNEKHDCSYESI